MPCSLEKPWRSPALTPTAAASSTDPDSRSQRDWTLPAASPAFVEAFVLSFLGRTGSIQEPVKMESRWDSQNDDSCWRTPNFLLQVPCHPAFPELESKSVCANPVRVS